MNTTLKAMIAGLIAVCTLSFWLPQCGGLNRSDFEQVNVSGFDPEDNAVDDNDYAYSMEYFKADGSEDGYVYVGTGNNIVFF